MVDDPATDATLEAHYQEMPLEMLTRTIAAYRRERSRAARLGVEVEAFWHRRIAIAERVRAARTLKQGRLL